MWTLLSLFSLLLAAVPCGLFMTNLRKYRRLPSVGRRSASVSLLIPARNEEANISAALDSILRSEIGKLEIIVLDDSSEDNTAAAVQSVAARDARVRLITGEPLPAGWCGKNFACHQLAHAARHPLLIFMDADVRVANADSLARLAAFLDESGAALVSGVPRQETRSFLEKLIIPLIHFVLLGFLPFRQMRTTTDPRFAAACGQILGVTRAAYLDANGHVAIQGRIHDALALARSLRSRGLRTDLFDATDTFRCRMYSTGREVWTGFAKNAHEGLGSSRLIVPSTLLLLGGQVAPFVLAAITAGAPRWIAAAAVICAVVPRLFASILFRQSLLAALLHPLSIALLVLIQWVALLRRVAGRPIAWKTRHQPSLPQRSLRRQRDS